MGRVGNKNYVPPNKTVFTEAQARNNKIQYASWSDPTVKKGDWIVSDDGYVCKILTRWEGTNNRGYPSIITRTAAGMFTNWSKEFKVEEAYRGYKITGQNGNPSREYGPASLREKAWADLVLGGVNPAVAASTIFKNKKPGHKASLLMRSRKVVKYMSEQLKDTLAKQGLDEEWVAKQLKDLALNGEKSADKFNAVIYVAKLLNMEPEKKRVTKEDRLLGGMVTAEDEQRFIEASSTTTEEDL